MAVGVGSARTALQTSVHARASQEREALGIVKASAKQHSSFMFPVLALPQFVFAIERGASVLCTLRAIPAVALSKLGLPDSETCKDSRLVRQRSVD